MTDPTTDFAMHTIGADDDYVASVYEPPRNFERMGIFVERIVVGNDYETPNSILAFVTADRAQQKEYLAGMKGIGVFLAVVISIWFLVLIVLKFLGQDRMGCSSGHAFRASESEGGIKSLKEEEPESSSQERSGQEKSDQDASASDNAAAAKGLGDSGKIDPSANPEDTICNDVAPASKPGEHEASAEASAETPRDDTPASSWKVPGQTCLCSARPEDVQRRKFQTRCVFAFFAVLSLLCSILLITHMYRPLESAAYLSGDIVNDALGIVGDLNGVVDALDETTNATLELLNNTPFDTLILCPGTGVEMFEDRFGFDPLVLIETANTVVEETVPSILEALDTAQQTGDSITNILTDVDQAVGTVRDYMWIIVLLICFTVLIIFSQLALMLAVVYREQKSKGSSTKISKFETCFGWTVLPLQIIVVFVSWVMVIAFCFGIVLTTDTCMPSFQLQITDEAIQPQRVNGRGTPDDVVLALVGQYVKVERKEGLQGLAQEAAIDLAKQRLSKYITGCDGLLIRSNEDSVASTGGREIQELELPELLEFDRNETESIDLEIPEFERPEFERPELRLDPLEKLISLQQKVIEAVDNITTRVNYVRDFLGSKFVDDECGPDNRMKTYLANMTELSENFVNLLRALKQGYIAISCPSINSLYVDAVYGAFCTEFATASASGLVLFFLISLSGTILITLRASWRISG